MVFLSLFLDSFLHQFQVFLHPLGGVAQHWSRQNRQIFLSENVVNLAVFTPDMEDQTVLLLEGVEAERALVVVHQVGEGVLQLPDEMPAEVSLQVVEVGGGLMAHLALQVKVALSVQRLLL